MITGTFYGKKVLYPKYNIPSIELDNNLLFIIHEKNFLKYLLTDKKGLFLCGKYSTVKINFNDKELLKKEFKRIKNLVSKNDYMIKDLEYFNEFPPNDTLNKKIIFTIWFGNSYTVNRDLQLKNIKEKSKCKVININENNLHLLKYPIHKSFKYLSSIHKSDYLRCYLMYYYGGGYSDLKKTSGSWIPAFNKLKNNEYLWVVGHDVDNINPPSNLKNKSIDYNECSKELEKKLYENKNNFIGVGFFIFKKNTKLINDWYKELNKRLDNFYEELKQHPAKFDRESKNGTPKPWWEGGNFNNNYPISWTRILGQILYPLQLDYLDRITKGIPKRADRGKYK